MRHLRLKETSTRVLREQTMLWLRFMVVGVVALATSCSSRKEIRSPKLKSFVSKSGVRFIYVPGVKFYMGIRGDQEQPLRRVTLSPFWIAETELTPREAALALAAVLPNFKLRATDLDIPIAGLCFSSAKVLMNELADRDGLPYVFPTEAQWECAARGGLESAEYPWGNYGSAKRLSCVDRDTPCRIKSYPPNGYGLYDVTGNVWEYVREAYYLPDSYDDTNPVGPVSGDMRLMRGGSHSEVYCPVTNRSPVPDGDDYICDDVGIRLALEDNAKYHVVAKE